jgi:hypothetical protein
MRARFSRIAMVAALAASFGCYHSTVDTGRPPSGVEVRRAWAHSFLGGLVPPSTLETAAKCPDGVAKVESQQSFLNLVAQVVTWGIYSPMDIRVQCAAPATAMNVPLTPRAEVAAAVESAAREAANTGEAVYVRF